MARMRRRKDARRLARWFVQKYQYQSPEKVARSLDIEISEMDMSLPDGRFRAGMITKVGRTTTIIVHQALPQWAREIVILHELGHFLLGHLLDIPVLADEGMSRSSSNRFLGRMENAANQFVAEVLMHDDEEVVETLTSCSSLSMAAMSLCVPEEFLDFKVRSLYQRKLLPKECTLDFEVQSDFLKKLLDPESPYYCNGEDISILWNNKER